MMYKTLLLDRDQWDLVIDANGNIAVASPPYSISQDVASAVKLFLGELWYDTTKGIPYFQEILGYFPPASLISGCVENAALSVSGVVSARCIMQSFDNRKITGQLQFIDESNVSHVINF